MQYFTLLTAGLSLFFASGASAAAFGSAASLSACNNEVVASETFIGKDHNVKLTASHCGAAPHVSSHGTLLNKRQSNSTSVNVCGAQCNTFCFNPSGGGPNEDDCAVIADAILYDEQNVGALFNITAAGTATDKITMQYGSCLTYFLNQDSEQLTYCRSDWSSLVTWLSGDCNAANNAHGGLCVAADQTWYIQVQHS
ncbi:hypothetical protein ONZ51_g633 [Trametes cubensis]|uniref:Uncharacterized protein n=1 Tax=Trametes cubensis TaxID=1111947 RepID=A0AAD7U578_9APHY|nr:hypothetical protein ONZ51_g633 [Trametes cubensis]